MPGKGVELPLPEASVAGDPFCGVSHRSENETATPDPPVFRAGEEAGILKNAKVLRDGGERHIEWPGQLGYRRPSPRQASKNRPAGGIRQGSKRGIQAAVRIFNHVVKYCWMMNQLSSRKFIRFPPGLWIAVGWGVLAGGHFRDDAS